MGNVGSRFVCNIVRAIVAPMAAPALLALGPAGPIVGGIVLSVQAIMGTVAAGNAIATVSQSVVKKRATPLAITTLDARPPAPKATTSKKK